MSNKIKKRACLLGFRPRRRFLVMGALSARPRHAYLTSMRVTTPTIARLFARRRLWAYEHAIRGAFGPIVGKRGRHLILDLAHVEARTGCQFSPAQLKAAGVHVPHEQEVA